MQTRRTHTMFLTAIAVAAIACTMTLNAAAQSDEVLYSFQNNSTDGTYPQAGLIADAAGNLYGTTVTGGTQNAGTVFELMPTSGSGWTETILHSFGGSEGINPYGGLVFDAAGNLYGTTYLGGTNCSLSGGCGTAFKLTPHSDGTWTGTTIYNFGAIQTGPSRPYAATLIFDSAGNLYGTSQGGGTYGKGTVYELLPHSDGTWTEKTLHSFCSRANCADGNNVYAGVIMDSSGNLYGTTNGGGTNLGGVAFELIPTAGGGWTEKVLHNFGVLGSVADGFEPFSVLTLDAAGNLYGTTIGGGTPSAVCSPTGCGTVFELTPEASGLWKEKLLHRFSGDEGYFPTDGLIFDSAGNLYGTTGSSKLGVGTVFKLTPSTAGSWTEKILHSFTGLDGATPYGGVIMDGVGNLYGTTNGGGANSVGAVFEVTP